MCERRCDFFGSQKKTEGFFWGCEKRTKGFGGGGMLKKVVIFLGGQILKL